MWADPYFGKPFGALSQAREDKACIGTDWENLSVPKLMPLSRPVDYFSVFRRTAAGALKTQPAWGRVRQAVVKLKKYAHERMVLSSYLEAPKYRGKSTSFPNLKRGLLLAGKLDIRRESRQGVLIGGRLRFLPLATKFGTHGKNMVRDGGYISEHMTEGDGYFLTLTFPGGTNAGYETMGRASGYCVDRLNRFFRYRVHRGVFTYVWELQKRGAPHLHYLFRVPAGTDADDFLHAVKMKWFEILRKVGRDAEVDLFERKKGGTWRDKPGKLQVDMRPIHETYSKYLAKYISKSSSKGGSRNKWNPGRWWGVSAPARKLIFAARLEVVLPVEHAPASLQYLKQWVNTLGDLVQDSFSFARIPNGEHDGISVQPLVGFGSDMVSALRDAVAWGDFTGTFALLECSKLWTEVGSQLWRINYHDCS